ncbi:MAG: VWA domain-containing protein [Treponema sp.]|uniref:VWA domain-containing protein n=1 Tax=Treponema sp. TaxID=166 RepID=UPI003FA2FDB8
MVPHLPADRQVNLTRNKTAHQTEDLSDTAFSNLCSTLFSNIGNIKQNLNANIQRYKQQSKKKRKFEKNAAPESAFGSTLERKQLVDAIEDAIQPIEPEDIPIAFPQNTFAQVAQHTLSEILHAQDVQEYMQSHEGLSENIQTDLLEWLQKTHGTLENENPFLDEAIFVAQQKKQSAEEIAADLSAEKSKIQYHYKRLPSVSDSKRETIQESTLDFDFYRKAFAEQKHITDSAADDAAKTVPTEEAQTSPEASIQVDDIQAKNTSGKNEQVSTTHAKTVTQKTEKDTIQWESPEKIEALRRNFIADMEKNLIERKTKWEQERIDAMRKQFLEELYKKIQNFMRLEKLLTPFTKNFGRLWDLSNHPFETSGFEILDTFAKLLEQDESLQELADLLGRQSRTQAVFEKELRDKIVITTEWHPQPAYRGEINGLKYSNDIAAVLPCELAMLKNPAAKKLFQLKFAQKQLLSFEYQNEQEKLKESIEQEEVTMEKQEPKGPIIICVDTSGSMHGTPENIAKTVAFALAKIAAEQERLCYIISFSTDIETLEVKPNEDMELTNADGDNYLQKLVRFLRMSFNGGTDAEPALQKALTMLAGSDTATGYKNADVLMISDFVMGNLSADLVTAIEQEKEKNTGFYSLVIGASGNKNTIACFNHNWLYDTNDTRASRHLVEQLHELKTRK